MARPQRYERASESDYYHITARGAGRRVIFDDDADRAKYATALLSLVEQSSGSLVAWCLMDNHVHLLFHLEIHELSSLMHRLHTSYAQYFNGRHGHVGPVFQGRFDSKPIMSDEHLLLAVKYIHKNPEDIGGVNWKKYPWSSYPGYTEGLSHCETELVIDIAGGVDGFREFHENGPIVSELRLDNFRRRLNDAEARLIIEQKLGAQFADILADMTHDERDRFLVSLREKGLSARQIERLTGIGRNIVSRAIKK